MKNYIKIISGVLLLLFLASCSKNQQEIYSCDEDINAWANENKESFSDLTREQMTTVPFPYQRVIYRTFSNKKKAEIWNDKLDIVLSQNWAESFKIKIEELKSKINPSFFSSNKIKESREYLNSWQNDVLVNMNIDTLTFFFNFTNISTEEELILLKNHPELFDYNWLNGVSFSKEEPGGGGANDCDCNWDISCSSLNMGTCEEGHNDCQPTNSGCGLLWMYPCKGRCAHELWIPDNDL